MATEAATFGQYLINKALPKDHQVRGAVTNKQLKASMNALAHSDPQTYVKAITELKRIGDQLATSEGLSVGLDDIEPNYAVRDKILKPLQQKFDHAKTDQERQTIAVEAQARLQESTLKHPGSLTLQVQSGARGNPLQYSNLVSGVGYARDMKGAVNPWLISRSYSEGMRPADYWATTNQSTMDVIKTYTAVSEPGELSKKMVNSMSDLVITEDDCGTHNGVLIETTNPDAIDRYLAKDTGSVKRNTLVTPDNQSKIAKNNKKILVRSPMTCEAADGVCQKCQGLDEKGHNHAIGINIGIRAAQAMSEPLTQFALNAKHGGRSLTSDKSQIHGIAGFRQITETPQQFVNKAALATREGKITSIEPAPQGGTIVYIDSEPHYVAPNFEIRVKKGQHVDAGDVLSEGIPKPDEVVKYKGLGEGRLYMVNTLQNLYEGQGKKMDRRHFELLAKSNMNHVRILEDPTNTFIKGDIVGYNTFRADINRRIKVVPLKEALGETLGKEYYHYSVGARVTPQVVQFLKQQKVHEVMIAPRAPSVEFVMKPLTSIPKLNPDWMARMAHQGLKPSILRAAHMGDMSNLHGTHPIPAYAYGVEFGKGEKGKY